MKRIASILLILTTLSGFSQKYVDTLYNFKVDKGNIVWQKVFENKDTLDLKTNFKEKSLINFNTNNLKETENTISFSIENDKINHQKYGGSAMFSAFYIQQVNHYNVSIDFKEKKYRVTIKNFVSGTLNNNKSLRLEQYVVKNNKIKRTKINIKNLNYYQKYFTDKFTIYSNKEDW
ncbi:hypothetical protein H9I45_14955 [Polaribacter haliotis]|uniref:DUF4468 domain-containing protein n=1 Tax=Polaribacter haliotis TaxID=1888915 RepID=A0A7L8AF79_9FLAO|nr:hypothetical protein [Polaribacter haliotis]QOD60617.1 hypothetical protein H9I45_14955 [Polaribacter haliotis]